MNRRSTHLLRSLAVGLLILEINVGQAFSQTAAFNYSLSSQIQNFGNGGVSTGDTGFEFTLNTNVQVTALGFYAVQVQGTDTPNINLYQVNGNNTITEIATTGPLAATTFGAVGSSTNPTTGTNTTTATFITLGSPVSLSSGDTYLVTAPSYWTALAPASSITEASVFSSATFLANSTYSFSGWNVTTSTDQGLLGDPVSSYTGGGFNYSLSGDDYTPTAATFEYTLSAVPEPSTNILLILSLVCLVMFLFIWRCIRALTAC